MDALTDGRSVTRVRYETRRRELTVTQVKAVTPHLRRITLAGDFTGFQSLGFDDHIKLFFPDPDTGILILPEPGLPPGDGPKPIMRDYTPRRFDGQTLDIEFALHEAGPATTWATNARIGDILNIGGPRGSMLISPTFNHYVLIGDDTALPAIARRLEELPEGTKVCVVAEVDGLEDRVSFETRAEVHVHWIYRQGSHANCLNDALKAMHLPQGIVHAWVACESTQAKLIRQQLIDDHGVNPSWIKASGYWRHGDAGAHETID
ncbi:siderophore-interacting protein [Asticcacaulis taihuensis]|jgi:NADPH-dependent ferric siderophore reductase|uniref:siderophore-interacting protein n=1 Tax=Asticcacaulis taihuensis TaxID=260084 RepID=UPI0026EEB6D7|nr:siderophore-interacting protein [Asticcacaulis taihuensis]